MSTVKWVIDFLQEALEANDSLRVELFKISYQEAKVSQTDPEQGVRMLEAGRALAKELGEPWWLLFFDHWRAQRYLYKMQDYQRALDIVAPAVAEAHKPQYGGLPQRICLHEDLVRAYLGIDPHGKAPQIEQSLAYMGQEVTPDVGCYFCHLGVSTQFAIETGDFERAASQAKHYLLESERYENEHHTLNAYLKMCRIALRRQRWDVLLEWASKGEPLARKQESYEKLTELLAYLALASRQLGDHQGARRFHQTLLAEAEQLAAIPNHWYYDAYAAYHEAYGAYAEALTLRRQELSSLQNKGKTASEANCLLEQCRLLGLLGQPRAKEIAAARQVAQRLSNPEPLLAKLVAMTEGEE